jgi:hypothetical protein
LPDFLGELAKSAGEENRLAHFAELLARAQCPDGIVFVASVPGTHPRQVLRRTPWGAAGIGRIAPPGKGRVGVSILSPYVGSWNADGLHRWCRAFEGSPERLDLIWIDKDHPWRRTWILPNSTLQILIEADASLLRLHHDPDDHTRPGPFHGEHHAADDRWSHAKLYFFRRGRARRLLVTSANFSTSAWGAENGDGALEIANFELGVCAEQADWPFGDLERFDDDEDIATVAQLPKRGAGLITWAQAVWDGTTIRIECRCPADHDLVGEIHAGTEHVPVANWKLGKDLRLRSATLAWTGSWAPPFTANLTCNDETVGVPIFDARPMQERESTLPPEVDEDLAQVMRDHLLLEQYGGRVAFEEPATGDQDGDDSWDGDTETKQQSAEPTDRDSYAVPAFVSARRHLGVVDNWIRTVRQLPQGEAGAFERGMRRRDGEMLIEAFRRQAKRDDSKGRTAALGATLAADEIVLRLKYFPEA